jgi:hypothetical protein
LRFPTDTLTRSVEVISDLNELVAPSSEVKFVRYPYTHRTPGLRPGNVATELAPAGPYWEAEPAHPDYLERIPNGYTCHFMRPGWKLPVRQKQAM